MGTRAYVHVYQMPSLGNGACVGTFYVSCDGYPDGLGLDIANWLKNVKLTNGWNMAKSYKDAKYFNRAGKMLVMFAASFGEDNVEFEPTDASKKEEFTYHITYDEVVEKFKVRVESMYDDYNLECYADEFEDKIKEECK